jgi:hypothetical protein
VRLVGRILVILFAFLVASITAAIVLTVGMLARDWNDLLALGLETGSLSVVIGLGAVVITGFALVPVLLVVAIAEGFALRSVLFYTGAGLVMALFFSYGLAEQATASTLFDREREIMAGAGIAGGFVYWVLAGRNAGKWRETTAR